MTGIFKKQSEAEAVDSEQPLFRTAMNGFNKSDVNLYINTLNKKINSLEELLRKANEKLREKEQSGNAAYETEILELREELRLAKMQNSASTQKSGMPEAVSMTPEMTTGDDLSDEFKDILI